MRAFRKKVILVVDDDKNALMLLHDLLKLNCYEVLTATNGHQCLELANTSPPDAILLDINMAGIDGWEVCQRLKSSAVTQAIPVIVISALAQKEDGARAKALGANDYFEKPLDLKPFMARLDALTGKSQRRSAPPAGRRG